MKIILIVIFCTLDIFSTAQKKNSAFLELIYPVQLTYDTFLVKSANGRVSLKKSKVRKGSQIINTYLIDKSSSNESSFSIYFGGNVSGINDTLYFLGHGNKLQIEIKDSFALRDL